MPSELSTTRLETSRPRSNTLNSDDFTQRRFRENRPSISHETLLAYQFPGFSDTAHPTIPEAAKTAMRQCQEQLQHHQAHLATLQITLERLQTHEETLQSHIAASIDARRQIQQHFQDLYHDLLTTATAHENVSTSALELLKTRVALQQTTGTIAALRYLQTELKRSTRSMRKEKAELQPQVPAIRALTAGDGGSDDEPSDVINRDHQVDADLIHYLDTHPSARKDQTCTQAEIDQAFSYQRTLIRGKYEAARLRLREKLDIDGLFEAMSKRQAEREEQPQAEMQSTQGELEKIGTSIEERERKQLEAHGENHIRAVRRDV